MPCTLLWESTPSTKELSSLNGNDSPTSFNAAEAFAVLGSGSQITPFSSRMPSTFELEDAYRVTAAVKRLRQERGEEPLGRKIGFTNRTIWSEYNVYAPMWGYVYSSTVHELADLGEEFSLAGLAEPRIEPEVMFRLATAPTPDMDERALLACIDAVAHGFEIVQCPFPDWEFRLPDVIAAYAVHGALVIGTPVAVSKIDECAAKLRSFTITLARNGEQVAAGGGEQVLGSPLLAFAHLAEVLARASRFPPVQAGEVVTTGTLTNLFPVTAGETLSTALEGIELPAMSVVLA